MIDVYDFGGQKVRTAGTLEVCVTDMCEERFWAKVNKSGPTPEHCPELGACWIWEASKNVRGYGRFAISGKQQIAHRVAWLLEHGRWPRDFACHHCDNPSCVRPAHLFDGTQKQNMRDASRKGRVLSGAAMSARTRHEKNGRAKLVWEEVAEIRDSHESIHALARRFGVSRTHIRRIRTGVAWTTAPNATLPRGDDAA